jgi:hypothetical protein
MENLKMCSFKNGATRVVLFYSLGLAVTVVFHLLVGWENQYAPPLSMVVATLFLVIGMLWAVLNITSLCLLNVRSKTIGELVVHSIVILVSTGFIFLFVNNGR